MDALLQTIGAMTGHYDKPGFWATCYFTFSVVALAANAFAWRFCGKRANYLAAFMICAVYLAVAVMQVGLDQLVPMPWCWAMTAPFNLLLLLMAWDVHRNAPSVWARALAWAFLAGVVLQIWLWLSWLPHRLEPYDMAQYLVYRTYIEATNALAAIEIAFLAAPGAGRIIGSVARAAGRLFPMPALGRRSSRSSSQ